MPADMRCRLCGEPYESGSDHACAAPTVPARPGSVSTPRSAEAEGGAGAKSGDEQVVVGTVLAGRYDLLEAAGRGGGGTVYRAHDRELGLQIALKLLPEGGVSDVLLKRLKREIRITRDIDHPNVSRVFDLGEADGRTFLTMRWIDGEPLHRRVRRTGPLDRADLRRLATGLVAALAAAHRIGVVHRDVKPGNVLVSATCDPVLVDFGIATADGDTAVAEERQGERITLDGHLPGTPEFMAPEQKSGEATVPATDLYSLALTLAYAASGRSGRPARPERTFAPLGRSLASMLTRCLEDDSERRPRSAIELQDALGRSRPSWIVALAVLVVGLGVGAALAVAGSSGPAAPGPTTVLVENVRDEGCGPDAAGELRAALSRFVDAVPTVQARADVPRADATLILRGRCRTTDGALVLDARLVDPRQSRERARSGTRGSTARAVAARTVLDIGSTVGWDVPRPIVGASGGALPTDVVRLVEQVRGMRNVLSEVAPLEAASRDARRRFPDLAESHLMLARVLEAKSRLAENGRLAALGEARAEIHEVLRSHPESEEARRAAALIEYVLVHPLECLREVKRVNDDGWAAFYRARISWRLGQLDVALREARTCLGHNRRNEYCHQQVLRWEELVEGRPALVRLIENREAEAWSGPAYRVRLRVLLGRPEEAALAYEAALGSGPVDVIDKPWLEGLVAFARGDLDGARAHLAELERAARAEDVVPVLASNACFQVAELAALLDDTDRVVEWAREGIARGLWTDDYWEKHFLFERARRDPRMADVIREARRLGDAMWADARRQGIVE